MVNIFRKVRINLFKELEEKNHMPAQKQQSESLLLIWIIDDGFLCLWEFTVYFPDSI